MYHQPRPGDSYTESLQTNQALASSAIKRAMADSNAGRLFDIYFPGRVSNTCM